MDEQQQELAAFQSSINDTEATEQATTAADAVAVESQDAGAVADGAEQGAVAQQAEVSDAVQGQPEKAAPAAEDEDPVLLDGLKRSELRRLLGNAADVETLKRQIDKAHGHIGELNRRFQQSAQAPAAKAQAQELSEEIKQFEEDFPEVAQYVRALGITPPQPQASPPADVQPAYADAQPAQAGIDPLEIEMAVMDRMHKGWREKISTQDFNLWIGAQEPQVRQVFDTAQTADEMASVLGRYDQWANARIAAADRSAKGQQRLQRAMTPSGNAPLPQSAPTELDAFRAALRA